MKVYASLHEMKTDPHKFTPEQAALVEKIVAARKPLDAPALPIDDGERNVTVGRKKRKRRKGAGSGVKVRSHTRSPRGPNAGKKRVRVDPYARGNGAAKRKKKRKR